MAFLDRLLGSVLGTNKREQELKRKMKLEYGRDYYHVNKILKNLGLEMTKERSPYGLWIEFYSDQYHNGWDDDLFCTSMSEARSKLEKIRDEHYARGETKARRLR